MPFPGQKPVDAHQHKANRASRRGAVLDSRGCDSSSSPHQAEAVVEGPCVDYVPKRIKSASRARMAATTGHVLRRRVRRLARPRRRGEGDRRSGCPQHEGRQRRLGTPRIARRAASPDARQAEGTESMANRVRRRRGEARRHPRGSTTDHGSGRARRPGWPSRVGHPASPMAPTAPRPTLRRPRDGVSPADSGMLMASEALDCFAML